MEYVQCNFFLDLVKYVDHFFLDLVKKKDGICSMWTIKSIALCNKPLPYLTILILSYNLVIVL